MFAALLKKNPTKFWNGLHTGRFLTDSDIFKLKFGVRNERSWKVPFSKFKTLVFKTFKAKSIAFDGCTRKDQRQNSEELYLPENEVCKYVGCTPTKVGSNKIDSWPHSKHFDNFLLDTKTIENFDINKLDLNRIMIGGGNSAMMENIRSMATPNKEKFSYEEMLEAINLRIHNIKLPYLGDFKATNVNKVRINPDAYSGFISSLVGGLTRREANSFTTRVSNWFMKHLKRADRKSVV